MNERQYSEDRAALVRRGALGEDVAAEIYALDAAREAQIRSHKLSQDIAQARSDIEREEAQKRLQQAHDDAVVVFKDLQVKAHDAATQFEALVEQAKAGLQAWKIAQQAAQDQATQVHGLRMQGAKPVQMPVTFAGDQYSLHLLRHAGVQFHQQILHDSKLPRMA